MTQPDYIRVLLIDDDEDDVLLTKDLLSEIKGQHFEISWVGNATTGLEEMKRNYHDVCLLDYRLGERLPDSGDSAHRYGRTRN